MPEDRIVNPSEHQAYALDKSEVERPIVSNTPVVEGRPKGVGKKTHGAFRCPICKHIAKTEQGLKVHITRSHPEGIIKEVEEVKEIKNEEKTKEVQEPKKEENKEAVETPEVEK